MKTIFKTQNLLVLLAAMACATLTGCLEQKEPNFNVNISGFFWQSQVGRSQKFEPLLWAQSDNVAYPLESVTMKCNKNTIEFYAPSEKNDYLMVSRGSFGSILDLNNSYEITAVARDGHMLQDLFELNYESTDTIPPVKVENFTYNGNKVKFTLLEMEKCKGVGLLITPYSSKVSPQRTNSVYFTIIDGTPSFAEGKREIEYNINLKTVLASFGEELSESCKVNIFVINKGIARESDQERTFLKDKTAFEE